MKCNQSIEILESKRLSIKMKIDDIEDGIYSGKLSEETIAIVKKDLTEKLEDLNYAITILNHISK